MNNELQNLKERLKELENDRLLDRAEKEELERVNKVLHHNLEEKVEVIADLEKENQELKAKAKKYDEIVNLRTTPNALESSLAKYMNKCMAFEKENEKLKAMCQAIPPLAIQNEKLIKAIEILKKKKVDLDEFLSCKTLQEFNDGYYKKWQLTQQEYELLKEVLE